MTAQVHCGPRSFPNNSALGPFLRVKLAAGYLVVANAADIELGVTEQRLFATDEVGAVRQLDDGQTLRMVASGAITLTNGQANVYRAAGGKIAATGSSLVGTALEAASGDGSVIEVLPLSVSQASGAPAVGAVEAKTADYTVTTSDSGKTFTTVGAAGTVVFSLPPATPGLQYNFRVGAAQELRIDPNGTETIALPSTGVQGAAGKYLVADVDGETVSIMCTVAGQWSVLGYTGTWTAQG